MKGSFLVLLGLALGLATAALMVDRGDDRVTVPPRTLPLDQKDEKEYRPLIDFISKNLDKLISFQGKTGAPSYVEEKAKDSPRRNSDPSHTSFGTEGYLTSSVFRFNKDVAKMNEDIDLFWVHFGKTAKKHEAPKTESQDPAVPATPSASKKSTTDLSVELTNGIVSSKIKVTYSFGQKELIEGFIERASFNFLMKVEQSVPNLYALLSELDVFMSEAVLQAAFPTHDTASENAFKVSAQQVARDLLVRPQTVPFEKAVTPADKKLEEMIKKAAESLRGAGATEHLVYTITPTPLNGQPLKSDYANYIDAFHLILVRGGPRLLVMVQSNHFSDSIEVSVNSKTTVFETINNLLHKVIYETWDHFLHLDPPADGSGQDGLAFTETFLQKLSFTKSGEATEAAEGEFTKEVGGGYSIHSKVAKADDGDYKVSVDLQKDGKDLITQVSFVPRRSQFNVGLFISSFIQKTSEDFASLAFSEIVRTAGDKLVLESIQKHTGSRYSAPFLPDIPNKVSGDPKEGPLPSHLFVPYMFQAGEPTAPADCGDRQDLKKGFPKTDGKPSVQAVLCWRPDESKTAKKRLAITLAQA